MINLPDSYYVASGLCVLLHLVALLNRHKAWALPFGTVAATISAWYLIEPFYFPELFEEFNFVHVRTAYDSVSIFCVALLVIAPILAISMQPTFTTNLSMGYIPADRVLTFVVFVWLALLAFGTFRMHWDVLGALFPIGTQTGTNMWSREGGAAAGGSGFIVSFASYVYVLCLATFGVLIFLVRKQSSYVLLVGLILIAWPYAFLQGARNLVLATVVPGGLAFLLFSRVSPLGKFVVAVAGLVALDFAFRVIVAYRNTGFTDFDFSAVRQSSSHLGLNMASELVHITTFLGEGTVSLSYGLGYLTELLNVIPRAIWTDKPLIGIDYSIARGFGDSSTDIGVFTTISAGTIGQGVLNFGWVFGPIAAALLLSVWIGVLTRFRLQATPLRRALFLVGLGLTFNLGRDITLLVLWPMVFGYLGVRLFERYDSRRRRRLDMLQARSRTTGIF
jgi:hypothetical protein